MTSNVDAIENAIVEWRTIGGYENYEVSNDGQVRNRSSQRILRPGLSVGYYCVVLCKGGVGKTMKVHQLVATAFLGDSEGRYVDHIDHNRLNNNISNLRYVSQSDNMRNSSGYRGKSFDFLDSLPPDAIEVEEYGRHEFENLYYHNGTFYQFTGVRYRALRQYGGGDGTVFVYARDANSRETRINVAKCAGEGRDNEGT
jgi:hypothetical protein